MTGEQITTGVPRPAIESVYLKGWSDKSLANITEAVDSLEPIAEKCFLHRHATDTQSEAENILSKGLETQHKNFADFMHKISTHFHDGTINRMRMAEGLFLNTHEARQYSLIVAIPRLPDYYDTTVAADGRNAWDNEKKSAEFAKRNGFIVAEDRGGKTVNVVPSKFIVGYWDDAKREWHPNPLFEMPL